MHNYIYQKQVKNSVKSENIFFNNCYQTDNVKVIIDKKSTATLVL